MAVERVGDMTLEALNRLVEAAVDRRLQAIARPVDKRSMREINESIRRNRISLPPTAKSSLTLLREDRDA